MRCQFEVKGFYAGGQDYQCSLDANSYLTYRRADGSVTGKVYCLNHSITVFDITRKGDPNGHVHTGPIPDRLRNLG